MGMTSRRATSRLAHRIARLALVALVFGGVLAVAEPASACSCAAVDEADAYGEASTAVIAQRTGVVDEGPREVGTYEVLMTLKGTPPDTFELSIPSEFEGGFAANSCDAGSLPEGPLGYIAGTDGRFQIGECLAGPWEPNAVLDLAEQSLAAPDGDAEVAFLWRERLGAARFLALDGQGRVSGYGFGPGASEAIVPCSDGETFAELVRRPNDNTLGVGDLSTLQGDPGTSVRIDAQRAPGFADRIGCNADVAWVLDRCDPAVCVASRLTVVGGDEVISETDLPGAVAAFVDDTGEAAMVVRSGDDPRIEERVLGTDAEPVEVASLPDDRQPFMAARSADGRVAVAVLDPASVDPTSERASEVILFDAEGREQYSLPLNEPALTELRWLDDGRLVVVGTGFFSTYQEVWIVGAGGVTHEQVGQPLVRGDGTILAMYFEDDSVAIGGLDDEPTVVLDQRAEQPSLVASVPARPLPLNATAHERVLDDETRDLAAEWAAVHEELAAGDETAQQTTSAASDDGDPPWALLVLVVVVAGMAGVAIAWRKRVQSSAGEPS